MWLLRTEPHGWLHTNCQPSSIGTWKSELFRRNFRFGRTADRHWNRLKASLDARCGWLQLWIYRSSVRSNRWNFHESCKNQDCRFTACPWHRSLYGAFVQIVLPVIRATRHCGDDGSSRDHRFFGSKFNPNGSGDIICETQCIVEA